MLYLPWPDQKVIPDRKKHNRKYWENAKVKYSKSVIINISKIRIYLWRVVGQKNYRDSGQEPGIGYAPGSPSHGVLNR